MQSNIVHKPQGIELPLSGDGLRAAVQAGDLEAFERLLAADASVMAYPHWGSSLLVMAAQSGSAAMVRRVASQFPSMQAMDVVGNLAAREACRHVSDRDVLQAVCDALGARAMQDAGLLMLMCLCGDRFALSMMIEAAKRNPAGYDWVGGLAAAVTYWEAPMLGRGFGGSGRNAVEWLMEQADAQRNDNIRQLRERARAAQHLDRLDDFFRGDLYGELQRTCGWLIWQVNEGGDRARLIASFMESFAICGQENLARFIEHADLASRLDEPLVRCRGGAAAPVVLFADRGNAAAIHVLVDRFGASLDVRNGHGRTLLQVAKDESTRRLLRSLRGARLISTAWSKEQAEGGRSPRDAEDTPL